MNPVRHSSYHIGSVDNLIDVLLDYSEIDVEQTLFTNFMDQLNDYKIAENEEGNPEPDEEQCLDYLECNWDIDELTISVLHMVKDCKFKYLLDENNLHIIDTKPNSKEDFLNYIHCNIGQFPLTQEEFRELLELSIEHRLSKE